MSLSSLLLTTSFSLQLLAAAPGAGSTASAEVGSAAVQAPDARGLRPVTAHTFGAADDSPTFPATLADLPWLDGHWRGAPGADGMVGEEIWAPPTGGARMAMFRMVRGPEVLFYELILLREVDGGLVMELKHFNRDLTGWEEKGEVRRFPLLAIVGQEARFAGITYRLEGPDTLASWVAVGEKDGSKRELELRYQRVR